MSPPGPREELDGMIVEAQGDSGGLEFLDDRRHIGQEGLIALVGVAVVLVHDDGHGGEGGADARRELDLGLGVVAQRTPSAVEGDALDAAVVEDATVLPGGGIEALALAVLDAGEFDRPIADLTDARQGGGEAGAVGDEITEGV